MPPHKMELPLYPAILAALEAGRAILEVYSSEFSVQDKEDRSPLTEADRRSHELIKKRLEGIPPVYPVLSEEGRDIPYEEREKWEFFWLVDPLDGTKEFIKRNGEFTVNIALIRRGKPILGIIYSPACDLLYFSGEGLGAYKLSDVSKKPANNGLDELISRSSKLPVSSDPRPFTVVGSRSHMNSETQEYFHSLEKDHGKLNIISIGSSLKLCMVAEGSADAYPRLGPTMEWDTAAGQAILEHAGGKVTRWESAAPLSYNKKSLLNPYFLASLCPETQK